MCSLSLELNFGGICLSIYYVNVLLKSDTSDSVHAPVLYWVLILLDKVLKSSLRLSQSARVLSTTIYGHNTHCCVGEVKCR